ncbi:hypothetical protein ACPXB3_17325 [Gordonia sp. DT219]
MAFDGRVVGDGDRRRCGRVRVDVVEEVECRDLGRRLRPRVDEIEVW